MTVIAIDGTFASGKGTLAKRLASHYKMPYLDTGKLYRAVAYKLMETKNSPENVLEAINAAQKIKPEDLKIPELKSGDVAVNASKVAAYPEVRKELLKFQKDFAKKGGILDGRDIGTIICPDAEVKLFIDAKAEIRAHRRHLELTAYQESISFETVLKQLTERDTRDMNRKNAPLKIATTAHIIDTTDMTENDVFENARKIIDSIIL
ncbi:MAG: (d)CMP kinase [Hellea sp.]|nr:(d)CMP kinase [Hellea sp.]